MEKEKEDRLIKLVRHIAYTNNIFGRKLFENGYSDLTLGEKIYVESNIEKLIIKCREMYPVTTVKLDTVSVRVQYMESVFRKLSK